MKYFTGIGARDTPNKILDQMINISTFLSENGYTLRSGGARGADSAFERGAKLYPKEIYLPWNGFRGRTVSEPYCFGYSKYDGKARELAKRIHPKWDELSDTNKKFHTRNMYQVLGQNLKTPSKLLICYTSNGKMKGGTRSAMVLAKEHDIPIYNLYDQNVLKKIYSILKLEKFYEGD